MRRSASVLLLVGLASGPVASASAGDALPSQITFQAQGETRPLLLRIEVKPGAAAQDLTPFLDAIATQPLGGHRGPITVSPDGAFYVFLSERFDPDSQGWDGLTIAPSDLSSAETVKDAASQTIHNEGLAQATSGGQAIVYVGDGAATHTRDLYVIERQGGGWGMPRALSGGSPYAFNYNPVLSPDETHVLFDAGDASFPSTQICEVGLDGMGFHVVVDSTNTPAGFSPSPAAHSGAYLPGGDVVFEAEWSNGSGGGERVWRLPAGGGDAVPVQPTAGDDNSPVTLPDGRIASLFLGAPAPSDGLHEIKVMDASGQGSFMLTQPGPLFSEVDDIGLGSGPLLVPEPAAATGPAAAAGALMLLPRTRRRGAHEKSPRV